MIPHVKIGRRYYIKKNELEEFIDKRSYKPLHKDLIPKLKILLDGHKGCVSISVKGDNSELKNSKSTRCNCGVGYVYPRQTKQGKVRWYVDYFNSRGERIQHVIKHAQNQEEAVIALLHEVQREYDMKYQPSRRKKISFKEFATLYLEDYAKLRKKSWKTDEYYLQANLIPYFGSRFLSQISQSQVEKYQVKRLRDGVQVSTVNRELACMRKLFNKAIDWDYAMENPVAKVEFFSEVGREKQRVLTMEEEKRLLEACMSHIRSMTIVGLQTGMRKGEILNLMWKDVDLKNGVITVQSEYSKSSRSRKIIFNGLLKAELSRLKKQNGHSPYVFLNERTGKPYADIKKAFRGACDKAKIKGLRFHDLRHSYSSRLVANGVDIVTVKELLGHSTIKMTERYTHSNDERKKRAAELLHLCYTEGAQSSK
jgi:integrase